MICSQSIGSVRLSTIELANLPSHPHFTPDDVLERLEDILGRGFALHQNRIHFERLYSINHGTVAKSDKRDARTSDSNPDKSSQTS